MRAAGSFTDKKERFSPIRQLNLDFTMQARELKLVKICLVFLLVFESINRTCVSGTISRS